MKNIFLFSFILLVLFDLGAQTDSTLFSNPIPLTQKITESRLALQASFQMEDPAGASLWLDSLNRLEDDSYIGANWDERWLLYYWLENYGALLAEASQFGADERAAQAWKTAPATDSLFEVVDVSLFEQRFELFQKIRHAFLNAEEKAFCTLLLEYLLRLNNDEEDWAARLDAFALQYPNSKYNYFLSSVKPAILKPANKGFGLSVQFLTGSWSAELERSLKPLFAAQMDFYYWVDRWNMSLSGIFGGPRLAREITDGFEFWPKNDPTNYFGFGLEIGYDVINNSNMRIIPAIGGGVATLKPPSVSEDSGEEIPEYYDNFNFFEGHLGVSLTADAKLFGKNHQNWDVPKGSYHGVRMRVGYNWLNFKSQNKMLGGNLFYLAVGYNLFAFLEAK